MHAKVLGVVIIKTMDKRYLHHLWTKVRPIRPWYFLLIASISAGLCVVALRANNLEMVSLRNAVYAADKNNSNVQGALQMLQVYVTSHMNTDLAVPDGPYPPIQLVYTYDRAVQAAGEQVSASNTQIYTDAQHYCEQQDSHDFYGAYRVPCVQQYIHNHGVTDIPTIPDSLYKFDFASPAWSPDLAGWSMVVAALSGLTFVVWAALRWMLKRASR